MSTTTPASGSTPTPTPAPIPQAGPIESEPNTTTTLPPNGKKPDESLAVRFASVDQEIEPVQVDSLESTSVSNDTPGNGHSEDVETLRKAVSALDHPRLQERRMSAFAFEPVSLPTSRVASNEDTSRDPSRHNTQSSGRPSPNQSPRVHSMHSPPITPAATRSRDAVEGATVTKGAPLQKVEADEAAVSIQISSAQISPPGTSGTSPSTTNVNESRPGSSGNLATRPASQSTEASGTPYGGHRGAFSIGPGSSHASSVPVSREQSPSRQTFSRPFTPAGDVNDPYAAHKRPPQSRNLDAIDPRFKFTALNSKQRAKDNALPRSSRSAGEDGEKRKSFFHSSKHHPEHDESSATIHTKGGSMSELKRFLKIGGSSKSKRVASPSRSLKSGSKTPPHHSKAPPQVPFDDTHGLTSKYGKFGKVLGAGAGGSVRLMKRSSDNTTFAVKEFRARHSYESEKEYNKKVTAEFCIGSTLHHGNIIESLDIIQEKGKWYEVMEYAPFDLFAIVMTGKMSRDEISCAFLQILSGVTYMHSMGLAHRDLKLDNVVVNEYGIMKIIDFGSASVFKYPFENGIVLSSGIVGSDPYLAPEVYDERKYDPQPTDIWSLAIIFCCMSLRRFPWKMPRATDNSYKLFASTPSPGTDMKRLSDVPAPSKSTTDLDNPERDSVPTPSTAPDDEHPKAVANGNGATPEKKPEIIKGPWRLMRLLPRESRHIISRMLTIDPKKRATMAEVIADSWVSGAVICRQEEGGAVIKAEGHTHTLEPPAAPPAAPAPKA